LFWTPVSTPSVTVVDGQGFGAWCGATAGDGTRVDMIHTCTSNSSDYTTTMVHELAHVYGFTTQWSQAGVAGVSDRCAINLPNDGTINAVPCQHDIEMVYLGYGQGAVPLVTQADFDAFWADHIATGINLPTADTLVVGAGKQYTPTQLQFTNGQKIGGLSLTGISLDWTSSDPSILRVDSPTIVRALTAGSATITVKVSSPLPPGHRLGAVLKNRGHQIAVEVVTASATFRVTAIAVDQEPAITVPGTHGFTATTIGTPPPSPQYTWTFIRSGVVPDTTVMATATGTAWYFVPGGSYTLMVTAQPSGGFGLTRFVNVCTGSLALAPGSGSEPSPDAVGGCGGGGGGGGGEPL